MGMESLADILSKTQSPAARPQEKSSNSELSAVGQNVEKCPPSDFARAMAHLVALKRTAALTDLQMTAWHNVLGVFDTDIVNAAVLQIALTDSKWPEVGDLFQLCRRLSFKTGRVRRVYVPNGSEKDDGIPSIAEIREIANRFGLAVPGG